MAVLHLLVGEVRFFLPEEGEVVVVGVEELTNGVTLARMGSLFLLLCPLLYRSNSTMEIPPFPRLHGEANDRMDKGGSRAVGQRVEKHRKEMEEGGRVGTLERGGAIPHVRQGMDGIRIRWRHALWAMGREKTME